MKIFDRLTVLVKTHSRRMTGSTYSITLLSVFHEMIDSAASIIPVPCDKHEGIEENVSLIRGEIQ